MLYHSKLKRQRTFGCLTESVQVRNHRVLPDSGHDFVCQHQALLHLLLPVKILLVMNKTHVWPWMRLYGVRLRAMHGDRCVRPQARDGGNVCY